MRSLLSLVLALAVAAPAAAEPGLLLGLADDSLRWQSRPGQLLSVYRQLGLGAVRVTLAWTPGQLALDRTQRTEMQRVAAAGRRVRIVLAVTGPVDRPPLDDASRATFCTYVAGVLARYPWIRDVAIWTEPNSATFWRPQKGAADAYAALLARCWTSIHSVQPFANVIATSAARPKPADWYAALGKAAAGRRLFDTVGHNPYPEHSAERVSAQHANASIEQGDAAKLTAVLKKAFGRVPPIWYLEQGFQSSGPPQLYSGSETDRQPVSEEQQAAQLTAAVRLAFCQPGVKAFFNFELRDEPSLKGWQSGLLRPDWSPKPAFTAYRDVVAAAARGTIECGQAAR